MPHIEFGVDNYWLYFDDPAFHLFTIQSHRDYLSITILNICFWADWEGPTSVDKHKFV